MKPRLYVYYITMSVTVTGNRKDTCCNEKVPMFANIKDVPILILGAR